MREIHEAHDAEDEAEARREERIKAAQKMPCTRVSSQISGLSEIGGVDEPPG
jgi:hypothetical protein